MERLTRAGAVFETHHNRKSTLRFHKHGMSFATIVIEGSYTEVRDNVPQSVSCGSLVIHSSAEEHADHFLENARCLNVELAGDGAACGIVTLDAALRSALGSVVHSFYRERAALEASVVELQRLLLNPRQATTISPPDWLQPVLENFDWCEALPLRDAARLAGVHPVQFSRAFHRHVGVTSNEYRRRARICRASELLLASTVSLARVAQECGFADQSHLTRTFGETVGLAPAQYRHVFAR